MILLFNCGGRTGNQLFQLSHAVSCRKSNEWILSFGFGQTLALLKGDWKRKSLNIDNRLLRAVAEVFLYPVLYHALAKTGLISSHFEKNTRCFQRRGKVRRLTMMKGYFETCQHQRADLVHLFQLRPSLRSKVRPLLDALPRGSLPVFVHLRRFEYPAPSKLPDRYYLNAIRLLRERHPLAFFVVVGDDPAYAAEVFREIEPKMISRMSASEDLALMSLCDGGVLSNSTFAWWGAFFGKRGVDYVVPKYWSGWPRKVWDPPGIRATFMTEVIDV